MGGQKAPPPPAPQPVTPVPQPDDPKSLATEQNAAKAAARREGATAHLLANPTGGSAPLGSPDEDGPVRKRSLTGVG